MEKRNFKGFTLIEVMLTLAIGGLIFAMVFMVLPSVFANARDGQRRDDVLKTVSRLKSFQSNNNRGALPSDSITSSGLAIDGSTISFGPTSGITWKDFYASFFDDAYSDPNGTRYNWKIVNCEATTGNQCTKGRPSDVFESNNVTMYFVIGATCNGEMAVSTPNNRMVSVLYKLERGGTFCANT